MARQDEYELLRVQLREHTERMRAIEERMSCGEMRLEHAEARLDEHEEAIVDDRTARMQFAAVVEDLQAELRRMTARTEQFSPK